MLRRYRCWVSPVSPVAARTEISIIITININNINIFYTISTDFPIYSKEEKHFAIVGLEIRFTIRFLVYVLTCLMYSSSRKYINPSWRSLIEMNKNNIFSRIVMRSASHRATINLSWEFQNLNLALLLFWLEDCVAVPPLDVEIFPAQSGSHSAGQVSTFHCQSHGSQPPATLAWFDYQGTKIKEATSEVSQLREEVWRCMEMRSGKTL